MRAREKETLSKLFDQHDETSAQIAARLNAIEEVFRRANIGERLVALENNCTRILAERTVRPADVRQMHEATRADLTGRIRGTSENIIREVHASKGKSGETFFLGVVVGALAVICALAITGHVG